MLMQNCIHDIEALKINDLNSIWKLILHYSEFMNEQQSAQFNFNFNFHQNNFLTTFSCVFFHASWKAHSKCTFLLTVDRKKIKSLHNNDLITLFCIFQHWLGKSISWDCWILIEN